MGVVIYIAIGVGIGTIIFLWWRRKTWPHAFAGWLNRGDYFIHEDHRIFYVDQNPVGDVEPKRTLLCLHGFPTSSVDYKMVFEAPAMREFRVVALDFLGFGFSDKPVGEYLISRQADLVEALVCHLKLGDLHILAHDYGDTVAQELLARHIDKKLGFSLRGVLFTNGGMFPGIYKPRLVQKVLLNSVIGPFGGYLRSYILFRRSFLEIFGSANPPDSKLLKKYYIQIYRHAPPSLSHDLLQYIPQRAKYRDRWVGALQNAAIPLACLYGPADPVNPPPAFPDHWRETVNDEICVLAPDVGHYPLLEDPEGSLNYIAKFLAHH